MGFDCILFHVAGKAKKLTSRIANKFFIVMVLAVIVPVFCLSHILRYHFERYLSEDISQSVIEVNRLNEKELQEISQSMHNMAMMFMRDKSFMITLSREDSEVFEVNRIFDAICANLFNLSLLSVDHIEVTFLDEAQNVYTSWNNNHNLVRDTQVLSWIEEAKGLHGGTLWKVFTPAFSEEQRRGNEKYVSLLTAFYNPENLQDYLGCAIISVRASYLETVFEKSGYANDRLYFCDVAGNVVMTVPQEVVLPAREWLAKTRKEIQGQPYGETSLEGTRYMTTLCALPLPWTGGDKALAGVRLTARADIVGQFAEFTSVINLLLFTAVLLILVVTYFLIVKMVQPLARLSEKMRSYQINETVTGLNLARRDELGDLNRSFLQLSGNITNLVAEIQRESTFKEKYQYEALVAQLTPHFLFNTLNTIRWMALIRKADNIVHCVDALGNLLRYSMNKEGEIVSLREELLQIKSYVDIQNYRFGDCLKLQVEVPEALLSLQVVKFVLQPLVENSIKHGFKETSGQGEITVRAVLSEEVLRLSVHDNGEGMNEATLRALLEPAEPDRLLNSVTGIGVHHVGKRIETLYGQGYGISIDSRENEYTEIVLTLPKIEGKDDEKDFDRRR